MLTEHSPDVSVEHVETASPPVLVVRSMWRVSYSKHGATMNSCGSCMRRTPSKLPLPSPS